MINFVQTYVSQRANQVSDRIGDQELLGAGQLFPESVESRRMKAALVSGDSPPQSQSIQTFQKRGCSSTVSLHKSST